DALDKLNDVANKKRKHADDIHDYFKANKRLKSPFQYKDHLPGTVLNELVLAEVFQLESLKLLLRKLFRSLEDWEVSSLQCMQRYRYGDGTLERSFCSALKVYKAGKGLLYVKRNKAISLGNVTSRVDFLFEEEPKKISEALKHPGWVDAMQAELNQFARNKV
ncbi:hypothetical protein Tco_1498313, partial [Tanacetum coccineum]